MIGRLSSSRPAAVLALVVPHSAAGGGYGRKLDFEPTDTYSQAAHRALWRDEARLFLEESAYLFAPQRVPTPEYAASGQLYVDATGTL